MTQSWRLKSALSGFLSDWYASGLLQRARVSDDYKIFGVIRPEIIGAMPPDKVKFRDHA